MPFYDFKCLECGTVFGVMCNISERESQSCTSCDSKNYQAHHTNALAMGDAVRLGVRKIDNGFREVLHRINSSNGRKSNLKDKLSRN